MSEWEDRTGNYLPKVLFTLDAVLHDLERNIFSRGQTSLSRGAFYRMAVSFSLLLFPRGAVDRTVVPFSGPTSAIACELRKKKKTRRTPNDSYDKDVLCGSGFCYPLRLWARYEKMS